MTDTAQFGPSGQQSAPPPQPQAASKGNGNGKIEPWNGVLPLRKNVIANGEEVDQLKFREPTGGDIERIGNPIILSIFEAVPKPTYDAPIMAAMMAHLAGVPPSTIRQLDSRDWQNGALMLFGFFVPDRWTT